MKRSWFFSLPIFLIWFGCREQPRTFRDDTLFVIRDLVEADYCKEDVQEDKCNGVLYFKPNGKILYRYGCTSDDTIFFYRGTYSLTDTDVVCMFNSLYSYLSPCDSCPDRDKQVRDKKFRDIAGWQLRLNAVMCNRKRYAGTVVYRPDQVKKSVLCIPAARNHLDEFCSTISGEKVFVDFHCDVAVNRGSEKHKKTDFYEEIILHYQSKYKERQVIRKSMDNEILLTVITKAGDVDNDTGISIRLDKNASSAIIGDMNNDGKDDAVITVKINEGGIYQWQDLFLFTSWNSENKLTAYGSSTQLALCSDGSYNGNFEPKIIVNGILRGSSACYTDEDEECCPSVKSETGVRLEKNALKVYR